MNKPLALLILLTTLTLTSRVAVAAPLPGGPDRVRGGTPMAMRDAAGQVSTWSIRLDDKLGTPAALFAPPGTRLSPGLDAARAGEAWFEANREALGLPAAGSFRFVSERHDATTRHLFFEQRQGDVPVEGGGYMLSVGANGDMRGMLGRTVPIREVANRPRLDDRSLEPLARRAFGQTAGDIRTEGAMRLLVRDGVARYARRVALTGLPDGPRSMDLDAETGGVLQRLDGFQLTTGSGNVYEHDGGQSLVQHDLPRLQDPGTSLVGQYVRVTNINGADVTGSGAQYLFQPSQIELLAQVNAYYHIDRLVSYLVSLGYPAPTSPIHANVNNTSGNLGYYDPQSNSVNYHLQLAPTANAALDAGTVAHEVGHYVAYSLGVEAGGDYYAETSALHEGLGHYFAGTYTNNPVLYQWVDACNPNPPNPPLARLDSDKSVYNYSHFNQVNACAMSFGDPHANGLILAGALWDLRVSVGANRADALLLKALPYCPRLPDFGCLFDALWMADIDYFDMEDELPVLWAELNRGIHCVPVVSIAGPSTMFVGVQSSWTASVKCPVRPTGFTWSLRHYCNGSPCEDWQEVGYDPTFFLTESAAGTLELKAVSLDDGGRTDTETKMVTVYYPLTVGVTGPSALQACEVGQFCATVSGHGPLTLQWLRNGAPVNGATGSCYSTSDQSNFTVAVRVRDAEGQEKTTSHPVTVSGLCPLLVTEVLGIHASPVGGLALSLRAGSERPARISLFDVAGRRVAPDWSGMLRLGTQSIELGHALPRQSVYFYRIQSGGIERRGTAVLVR